MKKTLLAILFLFLATNLYSAPTTSISVTPAAVDGAVITSADENNRNSAISSTYNAHTHEDITKLGTVTTGVWTGTTIAVANGGTGSSTASDARTALGLAIGTNVQAYDAQLADVAGLTPTDNGVIIGNGANFVVEEGATLKTSLGLTIGTNVQAYNANTTVLGSDISLTSEVSGTLPVANGGTGIATAMMATGTYNGLDSETTKAITGVGFRPKIVLIFPRSSIICGPYIKNNQTPTTYSFNLATSAYTNDVIRSLDADGFTVGDTDEINQSGETYEWIAWTF